MPVAFVTGATGMVGRNLADVLLENDWDVVCMVRDLSKLDRIPRGAKWVRGDLSDPQSLRRAVPGNTDCIFHCAANCSNWFRDRAQQLRENVGGTAALAGIARWGDMRMVFTSTGAINLLGQVWNQYADSKRQSEYQP